MSLIESVVASALMGIGLVAGVTAWDTATISAARAVRLAWASCIVRSELNAVLAAPFAGAYAVPPAFSGDGTVQVTVADVPNRGDADDGAVAEQQLTVRAYDPQSGTLLAQVSALKVGALEGDTAIDSGVLSDVMLGCPAR